MPNTVDYLTTYLASTDARDKLLKGLGAYFKLVGALTSNGNALKMGASMSEARTVMRLGSWIGNVKKTSEALSSPNGTQVRAVLYILRVVLDGLFSLLDNAVYLGHFFNPRYNLKQLAHVSRASLFYGYVFAVLVDLYDLVCDKTIKDRVGRYLILTRNACDMISSVGNALPIDLGAANCAALGLISATIATREQYQAAVVKTKSK